MPESADLMAKLKESSNDVQQYVSALKAVNAKLHKRIFQLEADNISLEIKIDTIKKGVSTYPSDTSRAQLEADAIEAVRQMGYTVTKNK